MCYFLSADMSKWSSHTCLFLYVYKQQLHHLLKLRWSAPKPLLVVITWHGCFEPRFRVVFENICAPEAWLNVETSFYSVPSALISPLHYTPAPKVNCRVKVNSQRRKACNSLQSLQIFISELPLFFCGSLVQHIYSGKLIITKFKPKQTFHSELARTSLTTDWLVSPTFAHYSWHCSG